MKNKFLILIICFICLTAESKTLKAGIVYTVEQARIEAFAGVPLTIDILKYQKYFSDKNFTSHVNAIKKNKLHFRDKYISVFEDNSYCVTYLKEMDRGYCYNKHGKLILLDFDEIGDYPRKGAQYNLNGMLETTSLSVSSDNQYIFDTNKKLQAHWIGKNCYNEQGELIMTRE